MSHNTANPPLTETLAHRIRLQTAVAETGMRALSGRSPEQLMQEICETLADTLEANFSELLELQEDDTLLLRCGVGWKPEAIGRAVIDREHTPQGFALSLKKPAVTIDLLTDDRFKSPPLLAEHGVVSLMTVPIACRDGWIGTLGVGATSKRAFSDDDVHFLESMAGILSCAHERFDGQRVSLEAGERELQRLGKELHDGLSQHLAGLLIMTHSLRKKLFKKGHNEEAGLAGELSDIIKEAIEQAHSLAKGFVPVTHERGTIVTALRDLAANTGRMFGIQCELDVKGRVPIPTGESVIHLFRIAQEAIHNAIKHGHASRVTIRFRRKSGRVIIEIDDNGRGMPAEPAADGIGLRAMRERAAAIGADLKVGPRPANENGVRVTCTLPATFETSPPEQTR